MTPAAFDITPFLNRTEGQYFERKSLFQGAPGAKVPRDRKAVRDQIAEYVAAFANADGGVLVMGIEDDGELTGHSYPRDVVSEMQAVPKTRLQPPLREAGVRVDCNGVQLLVFEVAASDAAVMVTGNGYPLRVGDQTVKATQPNIEAQKRAGLAESWESKQSTMALSELSAELLRSAKAGAGLAALSDEDYLLQRKLADVRGQSLALRRAAELLFARAEPDHPNAGVRVFRVLGTERQVGATYNVEERKPRIEGALPLVIAEAYAAVNAWLRRPSRLVGTRFRETPEYPDFAWKEALLNAVAHRDYGVQGRGVEVHLFDDRMEVTSPGGLPMDVSLEALRARQRQHKSRNPRLARVLADLGLMREQGEGIPRVYAEMEGVFLPEPTLDFAHGIFSVVLQNTVQLQARDREFLASLGDEELGDIDVRALLEAFRHGRVDNARMRQIAGLDTLGASRLLRTLRNRGLLVLHAAGANSYFELHAKYQTEALPNEGSSHPNEGSSPPNEGSSGVVVPTPEDARLASTVGQRCKPEALRAVLEALMQARWWTPLQLSLLLRRTPEVLVSRYLGPMTREGRLRRLHPQPNHPGQAYHTARNELAR